MLIEWTVTKSHVDADQRDSHVVIEQAIGTFTPYGSHTLRSTLHTYYPKSSQGRFVRTTTEKLWPTYHHHINITMKIFAKRTRKNVVSSSASSEKNRTVYKSDPIVEELLKKDPSEWNAKERRMVKRYQERREEEGKESGNNNQVDHDENNNDENVNDSTVDGVNIDDKEMDGNKVSKSTREIPKQDDQSDDDSDSESDASGSSDEESSKDGDIEAFTPTDTAPETSANVATDDKANNDSDKTGTSTATTAMKSDSKIDHEQVVRALLDQLNSKQKRTLSRKLDRQGLSVLAEVEKEAKEMLGLEVSPTEDVTKSGTKRGHDKVDGLHTSDKAVVSSSSSSSTSRSNKRRKKEIDWSSLPPEERLRRQEQARLQQEAAERRANGEDITKPGHKHPLNSQRRRANRRKPRWKKPSEGLKNDHNSSGFMMRKHGGHGEVAAS